MQKKKIIIIEVYPKRTAKYTSILCTLYIKIKVKDDITFKAFLAVNHWTNYQSCQLHFEVQTRTQFSLS